VGAQLAVDVAGLAAHDRKPQAARRAQQPVVAAERFELERRLTGGTAKQGEERLGHDLVAARA
jgi:hypothetical protein